MAERKGISSPVPQRRGDSSTEASGRRSAVSAAVPTERGQLFLEGPDCAWPFTGSRLLVGRAGGGVGADVEVGDDGVSRRHAELVVTGEGWVLRDLGSVNGTRLDGTPLAPGEGVVVNEGQTIALGTVSLRLVRR